MKDDPGPWNSLSIFPYSYSIIERKKEERMVEK
jgi:hypothetical protein